MVRLKISGVSEKFWWYRIVVFESYAGQSVGFHEYLSEIFCYREKNSGIKKVWLAGHQVFRQFLCLILTEKCIWEVFCFCKSFWYRENSLTRGYHGFLLINFCLTQLNFLGTTIWFLRLHASASHTLPMQVSINIAEKLNGEKSRKFKVETSRSFNWKSYWWLYKKFPQI